jgi:hypothetical protein
MSQIKEWQDFQKAYSNVCVNKKKSQTDEVLSIITDNKNIQTFINKQTVLARQATKNEKINSGKISVQKGDWVVLSEKTIQKISQPEFEFLYEHETSTTGSGAIKMFRLKKNAFFGIVYEGRDLDIIDSKGNEILLENGDLLGSYQLPITKNSILVIKKDVKEKYFFKTSNTGKS